jgi:hypothetical protein
LRVNGVTYLAVVCKENGEDVVKFVEQEKIDPDTLLYVK